MSYSDESQQQILSDAEAKASGSTDVELWLKKVKAAQDDEKDWREQAGEAILVYEADKKSKVHFNLFHSNVQTTLPTLYNTTPIPDARRRFGDKDPVAKLAVDILERGISYSVDQYPFDRYLRTAVKDSEVAGRGTVRLRVRHEFNDAEQVAYSAVTIEPVKWDKWGRGPGLFWEQVPFVYFEHDLDQEDVLELIGDSPKAKLRMADLGFGDGEDKDKKDDKKAAAGVYKTIKVFEIWDKRRREVLFVAQKDKRYPLKVERDPLGLEGFFPVPSPLQAIERLGSLEPIVPYDVYKHLLEEVDDATRRIKRLIKQLKVRGLVAADMIDDFTLLRTAEDGEYVPASNAMQFATGGGGLEKAIAHWPLDPSVQAIKQLIEQREATKQLIYEVTGIADILRGASDPSETLGAQKIKTQWGSLRLQDRQGEVARFARDIFRLKAELISRFEPNVLAEMTGIQQSPQDQQLFMAAVQLLRDNMHRKFKVDIETDSTIRADMGRNQEQMNQFMAGTAQFVQGLQQAATIAPQFLPAMIEVYLAFARHFKLGKQAEDAIESLGKMAPQMAQQAMQAQAGPSPEEKKAELQMQLEKQKSQLAAQADQQKLGLERERHKMEMEQAREKFDLEQEREVWLAGRENVRAEQKAEQEEKIMARDAERAEIEHGRRIEISEAEHKSRMVEAKNKNRMALKTAGLPDEDEMDREEVARLTQALSEGLQNMAQEQREATQATLQVVSQLVQALGAHMGEQTKAMGEQTKVTREMAANQLRVATAKRRLVKNADGSKHTEVVM